MRHSRIKTVRRCDRSGIRKGGIGGFAARNKKRKRDEKFLISEETFYGFAFIAGYTAGGAAYGITIEEAKPPMNADLSFDASPSAADEDMPF